MRPALDFRHCTFEIAAFSGQRVFDTDGRLRVNLSLDQSFSFQFLEAFRQQPVMQVGNGFQNLPESAGSSHEGPDDRAGSPFAHLGLLVLRLVVGLLVAGHGAQKLFGWFKGHGVAGAAGWLASIRLPACPPPGIAGRWRRVRPRVWASEHGMELPLTNMAAAVAVGMSGPGAYLLDALWGTALPAVLPRQRSRSP